MNALTEKSTDSLDQKLTKGIQAVMRTRIDEIINEEALAAAKRVDERIRGMAGEITARAVSHFSFERFGTDLRITVKLPDPKDV